MTEPMEKPPAVHGLLETSDVIEERETIEERAVLEITERLAKDAEIRMHYYVKICVSAFLCMVLLLIGVPVFMISRTTGSVSYTALGIVLVGFGLILAATVFVLLFRPPWRKSG